jgi:predicted transcriptional regulator
MEPRVPVPLHQHEQQAGQSVGAPNVNSLPLDNSMLRIVATVQQFMTEFISAVSEEEKIVAIKHCLKSHEAKW